MKSFFSGLCVAFSLYSKIPVPRVEWTATSMRYAMGFLPLIGVIVGLCELFWLRLAQSLGVSALLYAVLAVAIPVLLTGGIHLDGFADTCDALASWSDREKRLEILKDPRLGAFGAMDLAVLLLVQAGLYAQFYVNPKLSFLLPLLFPLARCFGGLTIVSIPCAKTSGLAHTFSQGSQRRAVGVVLGIEAAICLVFMVDITLYLPLVLLPVLGVLYLLFRRFCQTQFGGVTGDLAGFSITLGETLGVALCAAAALL